MDLSFSAEEQAFRREVREFIEARLDPALHRRMCEGRGPSKEQLVVWQTTLAERGWATPAWPVEHGGPGWDAVWRLIFLDEIHQAPAPEPLSFNSAMLGPTLIAFGSEEQKERFLPDMATLKSWWCQGFSEAGAGSDLAAVTTTAVLDGDHYVVSGHKLWQGMAHRADWMFALVRTDLDAPRKQQGLSFLLIDMTSPGLAVRPILTIDQRHEVNEIFLDAVRVPVGNRVGAEGDGWTITKYLLAAERTNIARTGMTRHILRRVKAVTGDDRSIRLKCAAIEAELYVLEVSQFRILAGQQASTVPDPRSSILKLKGVELRQAASELLLEAAGPVALRASDGEPDNGCGDPVETIAPNYFILRAASIYGGASEVQKNILAKSLLGA